MDALKFLALIGVTGGAVALVIKLRKGGGETYRITQASAAPAPATRSRDFSGLFEIGVDLFRDWTGRNDPAGGGAGDQGQVIEGDYSQVAAPVLPTSGGQVWPLQQVIQRAESGGNYDIVYSGSAIRPARPITTMTVNEVMQWQRESVAAGSYSSAAGAYQIIRSTLAGIVRAGVLSGNERFDRDAQDRAGLYLMRKRGLDSYQRGQISQEDFGNRLAKEWAGLPVLSGSKAGRSYYAGDGVNGATVTVAAVKQALSAIRGA